jgi:predicted phage terminase large subunit-like protein
MWEVVMEKATLPDGTAFFPQKLSLERLEQIKQAIGSYQYANQYDNEIVPLDKQTFKREWFRNYSSVPKNAYNFVFVDPAISQADSADFTGVVCVAVDSDNRWYVRDAKRYKITPTQIIELLFRVNDIFKPLTIGIEEVAYQKSLIYFMAEEMKRRNKYLPIKGVLPPIEKNKQMRILSLVPRMEYGHLFLNHGLHDLEMEFLSFPRGAHDDLIDALASIEYIYSPPKPEPEWPDKPAPNHPAYEKWYIQNMMKEKQDNE